MSEEQNNRIAQLHSEIAKRDSLINELEEALAAKDEINRKLTIRLMEVQNYGKKI